MIARSPPRPAGLASRRGALRLAAAGALATLGSGCATPERLAAIPRGRTGAASVLGIANERFYPTLPAGKEGIEREFGAAVERRRLSLGLANRLDLPTLDLLSVSGGGENGAFGAGLLCGWTEHGTRPEFELVTGVSTGALTAPFAFLGPAYDPQLRSVYTDITANDVLETRGFFAAVFDDAMADNSPLYRTISRHLDGPMLAAIARAYDDGRLLLVGTTDLDAQLPVLWNLGAIARSGHPRALDTLRRILLASAAIPGAFPPVMFDVTLDGRPHQEMHVDGGAFAQAFLYPQSATRERRRRMQLGQQVLEVRAFVIRNARLDPEWSSVDRRTLSIAGRAIATMITASGYNDILRMYNTAQRDGLDFNLAFIGKEFTGEFREPFEQPYMRALFDFGFQQGRRGYDWAKSPPI